MQSRQTSADAAQLRRSAEELLGRQSAPGTISQVDKEPLVHELQVHQIELELQNEELRRARNSAEVLAEKFSNLYDFAPVGYLTLDREGHVRQANLACASLVGVERSRLVNRRFGHFLAGNFVPIWNDLLKRVFEKKTKQTCELQLLREGKPPIEASMEAEAAAAGDECYGVLRDITEFKRSEGDRLQLSKLESTGILAGGNRPRFQKPADRYPLKSRIG